MTKYMGDPGHGGKDSGGFGNGLKEKDVVLPVALDVDKILERHGVQTRETRTADRYVGLSERAKMANDWGADIFVSYHCNAFSRESAKGVETYHYPSAKDGQRLAAEIQNSIKEAGLCNADRGIKSANFAVLRETKMTAVLVEMGFLTNIEDAKILRDKQSEMALAIAKGILKYLKIEYKEPVQKPTPKPESDTMYRVVTGSFSDKENAEKRVADLRKAGFDSFITTKQ